jgi:hypothetical protein
LQSGIQRQGQRLQEARVPAEMKPVASISPASNLPRMLFFLVPSGR